MRFDHLPWREAQIPIDLSQGGTGTLLPRDGCRFTFLAGRWMLLFSPQFLGVLMRIGVVLMLGALVTVPLILAR